MWEWDHFHAAAETGPRARPSGRHQPFPSTFPLQRGTQVGNLAQAGGGGELLPTELRARASAGNNRWRRAHSWRGHPSVLSHPLWPSFTLIFSSLLHFVAALQAAFLKDAPASGPHAAEQGTTSMRQDIKASPQKK